MGKNALEIETLSCLTLKIWGLEFDLQPSKVNSGQKYFCCLKAYIINTYSIFGFKVSWVTPWPSTFKSHLGSKKVIPFESPYMTSYLTSMDNISLSRTVFEIFDLKVFRVWPWNLNPEGNMGSKFIIPFERSYMTSYLTSMGTISLSRTVFEIFDLENSGFDLDLCPLNVIWGWKKFVPLESPYMTSYLTSTDNISLSRTVFEIFDFKVFRVWPWPLTH